MKNIFAKDPGSRRSSWRSEQSEDNSSGILRDLIWPFTVSSSRAGMDMVLSNLPRLGEPSCRGKLRHHEGAAGRGVTECAE